jgi:hypothetical protein
LTTIFELHKLLRLRPRFKNLLPNLRVTWRGRSRAEEYSTVVRSSFQPQMSDSVIASLLHSENITACLLEKCSQIAWLTSECRTNTVSKWTALSADEQETSQITELVAYKILVEYMRNTKAGIKIKYLKQL